MDTGLLAPLRDPPFRRLWAGAFISTVGEFLYTVTASWLMFQLTNSSLWVGGVAAARLVPIITFALLTGAIADRLDRRHVLFTAHVVMAAASAGMALLSATGAMTAPLLLTLVVLLGVGTAFNGPAWYALVPDVVARRHLPAAISLEAAAVSVSSALGPPIAGVTLALAGAQAAFLLNALSYVPVAFIILTMPATGRTATDAPLGESIKQGVRAVRTGGYLILFAPVAVLATVSGTVQTTLPDLAAGQLRGNASLYGFLYGMSGIGTVVGVGVRRWLIAMLSGHLVGVTLVGAGLSATLLGCSGTVAFAATAMFLAGVCGVCGLTTLQSTAQLRAPAQLRGRIMSLFMTTFWAALSVTALLAGGVSAWLGSRPTLVAAGVVATLAGMLVLRGPVATLVSTTLQDSLT